MIKGVHFVRIAATKTQPIRWYVYAWRGGPRIMISNGPAKPMLDRDALTALAEAMKDARPVIADTLAGMIHEWRPESPEWKRLAESTRATWGRELDLIEDRWGTTPIALWNDPRMVAKVVAWRDSRATTPRSADIGVTVLGQLLEFGRLRARVTVNVAAGVPQIYGGADRAEILWTDDDIERFMVAALQLNRPHVIDALWLALLTGMRRADLVGLRFGEIGDQAIVRTARKKSRGKGSNRGRRRRAVVPLIPRTVDLVAELRTRDRAAGCDTVLINSKGTPWAPAALTQAFNQVRDHAGIVHEGDDSLGEADRKKHLHDCRGTFVTELCRAGLTDREIADVVAWSPENVSRIRKTYVDDAATVVALSDRIASGIVKRAVK